MHLAHGAQSVSVSFACLPPKIKAGGGERGVLKQTALPQRFPALENHMGSFKPLVLRLHPRPSPWESTKDPGISV